MKKLKYLIMVFVFLASMLMLGGCSKILEYKVSIYSYDSEDINTLRLSPSGFVFSTCSYEVNIDEVETQVQTELDRIDEFDMSTDEGKEVVNSYREAINKTKEIVKNRADKLDFSYVGYVTGLTKEDSETIKKVDKEFQNKLEEFNDKYNEVLEEYSESLEE